MREMTRARALRLEGRSDAAVSALEEVLRSSHRDRPFPRDVLGYELARARVAWATDLEAPASVADPQLRRAAAELARLMKHEPLRNLAELRVLHARALAAVDGGSELGQRRAAQRAERALSQILTDYPRHPLVGELRLMRARALVRMKKPRVAFVTMRSIWIERAGEPEAEAARRAMIELARIHRALKVRAPTRSEKLQRSKYARGLRRFGVSRQILNDILTAPRLPRHQRDEALRERAYTAYRQRDYGRCVADLREIYRKAAGVPADLVRCLERAHQYDEAMDVYLAMAGKHSGGGKAAFIWEAIELGFRGGRYARVRDLLSRYENLSKRHEARRGYLRAWIAYRLGDDRAAIDGLSAYARQCRGTQRAMARYFRGKILFLRGANDSERAEGRAILTDIAQDHPLSYYGLAARQRLLDGGHPLPPPEVAVVPDEAEVLDWRETEILLRELAERFDGAFVGLPRAAQLFAAGYLEEARRELRFTSEAAINGLTRMRGRRIRVPRSEALYVGLGWRSDWDYPKPLPGKGGRAALRNPAERDALLRGLRRLALAMDEPYYFAKFTPAVDHDVQSRWHPRAYREAVEREAEARTLNPEHLWALMYTESRFRRHVVSHMGARGALQIMPATGRRLAARLEFIDSKDRFDADQLFDIDYNVHLSAYYVAELMQKFRGQATFAYAAYNGGPNSVARWLTAKHGTPEPLEVDTFIEEIAFRETRRYTKRVMAVRAAYHLLYHGKLPRWDNSVNSEILDNIDF
ncbi:MAG: lytic transglycosylase domain-containing protein [bacterium]|nr:lytic transglycosylase domain-containing protein [bacterium]